MAKSTAPAFPQPCTSDGYAGNSEYQIAGGGMTLRDYFAAKAMQAILGNLSQGIKPQDCIVVAEDAYFVADAMLIARDKAPAEVSDGN